MNKTKQYIDYKIGDSVYYHGPKFNCNGKTMFYGAGFICNDFIFQRGVYSSGFSFFANREYCRTTFEYNLGSGKKRFMKKDLKTCRVLLYERKLSIF